LPAIRLKFLEKYKNEKELLKMKVQFLDLKIQNRLIKDEVMKEIGDVIDSAAFAGGPYVEKFENEFAKYCGCKYAAGVGNGTDALWVVLLAMGIGRGDEVITTPNSFIATAEAISFSGATPVFVDVLDRTYSMDPELFEKAITPRTKAVIPVHIFGQVSDMDPILEIAKKHKIYVIEDACQAHGAKYKNKPAGSIGHIGAFSFYPGKNLGAFGEAGAVTSNDEDLIKKIKMFRDHGQAAKYYHDIIGWNARMDGFQGAVLNIKLKHLDGWNDERRALAVLYNKLLGDIKEVALPHEADYSRHIYHIFCIRVNDRDGLINHLRNNDIGCGIHYPVPIHLQKAYKDLSHSKGSFPVAEKSAEEFVSLPMFPGLKEDEIKFVADKIKEYYKK
jgi:dTDP-4-amino-4,6-dideoxygalactose transaminase